MDPRRPKPFTAELQRQGPRPAGGGFGAGSATGSHRPAIAAPGAKPRGDLPPEIAMLVAQIAQLESKVDELISRDRQLTSFYDEVSNISGRIDTTKRELANVAHPRLTQDRFRQAATELAAVVATAESSTNKIMESAEKLDAIIKDIATDISELDLAVRRTQMIDLIVKIYEACNFQDLTGQRINKVMKTIGYIESRIQAIVQVWGSKALEQFPVPVPIEKIDSGLVLKGPQDTGQAISQADIDALFN